MILKIQATRTKEWVQNERVRTGYNVEEKFLVEIDTTLLPVDLRRKMLSYGNGCYTDAEDGFSFDMEYEFQKQSAGFRYGIAHPILNGHDPTPAEIIEALRKMFDEQDARIEKHRAARLRRQREELVKKRRRKQAEALLASELKQLAEARADRNTLANFLREVPQDALRGTAKRLAVDNGSVEDVIRSVEDASPYVIFDN